MKIPKENCFFEKLPKQLRNKVFCKNYLSAHYTILTRERSKLASGIFTQNGSIQNNNIPEAF